MSDQDKPKLTTGKATIVHLPGGTIVYHATNLIITNPDGSKSTFAVKTLSVTPGQKLPDGVELGDIIAVITGGRVQLTGWRLTPFPYYDDGKEMAFCRMSVAELITELQKLDPALPVFVYDEHKDAFPPCEFAEEHVRTERHDKRGGRQGATMERRICTLESRLNGLTAIWIFTTLLLLGLLIKGCCENPL